ncbi:MAG: glucosaminidase domain-containing protein [Bacteroidales bacterium]
MADTTVYSFPAGYMKSLDNMEDSSILEISSYQDILDLFEKRNYTPEAWQAGIREVPRIYLTIVGDRWGSTTSKEVTVLNKKRIFFRSMAPMILQCNEWITMDRDRLEKIRASFMEDHALSEYDQLWVLKLADLYKTDHGDQVTIPVLDELWEKVDIVPPSLALAQGAEESGWGTSRFAAEGNAVYGQWTWGKQAIKPEAQRKELGNYGIRAFEALQESVCAYMLNLNTHPAYADLRAKRAELRSNGQKVTGSVLAKTLINYSERGEEYVKTLENMMDYNRLEPADDAFLTDSPPIYMIPAADPGP